VAYFTVPIDVSKDDAYFTQHIKPIIILNKLVDMNIVVIKRQN
jgi:hypothetical protein